MVPVQPDPINHYHQLILPEITVMHLPSNDFRRQTNVIYRFIPTPPIVLNGLETHMVLRGLAYWVIGVGVLILTRSSFGYEVTDEVSYLETNSTP